MVVRTAIVGCGLVGAKRARALGDGRLVAVADIVPERARGLAALFAGCTVEPSWEAAVARRDVDVVIVATTHDALVPVACAAAQNGKHVLVEKPGGRCAAELLRLAEESRRHDVAVRVGFNHRFHPALRRARAMVDAGDIGPLLSVRGRYGHGGRPGYEREWRADPQVGGGGSLIDQGVHLIDLARWFAGNLSLGAAHADTLYWEQPVEDNAFLLLLGTDRRVAWLHVSSTEWKNLFSFEVFGRNGKLQIDGLGGSYGTERLTFYRMLPEMGPPETSVLEFPGEDSSWRDEWTSFVGSVQRGEMPEGNLDDAVAALTIVDQVYEGRRARDGVRR